ncbi:concanavalin A-like lectin/glucanase domain, Serine/threonine-protein kinase, SIK1/2 [Artemisia annua]|uniref:Concanavalin A-like lectin/glucanase domain, Serine/threonine-protein kinase, SIK1/2 n=1 Tax=Artemisia annua TaxID=35608 RepID=A0A2U1N5F0_ARTAN|nr:concanavalin A-like lectin/glucanase domain, Serine/threonine-protein kinase, SIK1/2 [Artemisia annua]
MGSSLSCCDSEKVDEGLQIIKFSFSRLPSGDGRSPWRIFTFKELHSATNGFSEDNKLGEGGFGSVYWGKTSDGLQFLLITPTFEKPNFILIGWLTYMMVKGTLGYLAPEYAMWGKVSESCDVYSFGILLLELVTGRKPIEKLPGGVKRTITEWAEPYIEKGRFRDLADPKLRGNFDADQLKQFINAAALCVQSEPERRPNMKEVVALLKGYEPKGKMMQLRLKSVKYGMQTEWGREGDTNYILIEELKTVTYKFNLSNAVSGSY